MTAGPNRVVKTISGSVVVIHKKQTKEKFNGGASNSNKVSVAKKTAKRRVSIKSDEEKSEDIMDSRLMYHGSYGSGKNR